MQLRAVIGPIGSGFDQFVKVYQASLPELVDFDNSSACNLIYEQVRANFGVEWWNIPEACRAKDQHISALVAQLPKVETRDRTYMTTEPSFALLDGDLVGVLPLPHDIARTLREEAKTKELPVPTTIGSAMHLYNAYRELYCGRNIQYFQTPTEAYKFLQSRQAYAV